METGGAVVVLLEIRRRSGCTARSSLASWP